jgi:hypothetical protein
LPLRHRVNVNVAIGKNRRPVAGKPAVYAKGLCLEIQRVSHGSNNAWRVRPKATPARGRARQGRLI